MYQAAELKECMRSLVGFAQPHNPGIGAIDSDLLTSASNLFVSAAHPLVTIDILEKAAPAFATFTYPTYATLTAYRKGQIVKQGSTLYYAVVDIPSSNVVVPGTDTAKWVETTPMSAWLREQYDNGVTNVITRLLADKKVNEKGKSLLQLQQLYRGRGTVNNKVVQSSRFVGFQLKCATAEGIANTLTQIGLQLDTAMTLKIYLYHSSKSTAIGTIDITTTVANDFAWASSTLACAYMNSGTNSDGVFYLGYYEDDLAAAQAIYQTMDFSQAPCQTCDDWNLKAYASWSKYLNICAIAVPNAALDTDKLLFDTSKVQMVYDNNFGLNLNITTTCDLTNVFCTNKMLIAEAVQMSVALELLREIAYSPRMTTVSDRTKGLAMADLNPDASGAYINEFYKIVKALDIDFSGHSKSCMPCAAKNKIRASAV